MNCCSDVYYAYSLSIFTCICSWVLVFQKLLDNFDVFDIIANMRNQRPSLVQSLVSVVQSLVSVVQSLVSIQLLVSVVQ